MSDNQFDKFFRDKLQDHSSPVPENMWERIMGEKDRDRKVFILPKWYGIAAILLILVFVSGYFIFNNNATVKKETAQSKNENKEIKPFQKDSRNTTNENKTNTTDEVNATLNKGTIVKIGETRVKKNTAIITDNTVDRSGASDRLKDNKGLNNKEAVQPSSSITNPVSPATEQPNLFIEHSQPTTGLSKTTNADEAKEKQEQKAETATNENKIPTSDKVILEAFVSPELAWKTTMGNFNSNLFSSQAAFSNYARAKENSETFVSSFAAGLRIIKPVSKHLLLKTGLQYTQLNEKFSYEYSASRLVPVVTTRYINYSGALVGVQDTSNYMQVGFRKKTTYNHYRSINVPLLISYERGTDNFKLGATAGAIVNVISWYDGETLDAALTPVPVKSASAYKTNTGVGLYLGLNAIKKISSAWQIFAEPHVQYNLSEFTTKNAPVKQKIHNAGISLGVRYNLLKAKQQ